MQLHYPTAADKRLAVGVHIHTGCLTAILHVKLYMQGMIHAFDLSITCDYKTWIRK